MIEVGQQLKELGFARGRQAPSNWRTTRMIHAGPGMTAGPPEEALEPGCSPALLMWRDLLANGPRPSPYRISRVDS